MSIARPGALGATRTCPHCKATVLASAAICPGCQHHLRFNPTSATAETPSVPAVRIEGAIRHAVPGEACEYCVVVAITNERGEKIARQVIAVGALPPGEGHRYSFSVELIPARGAAGPKRG